MRRARPRAGGGAVRRARSRAAWVAVALPGLALSACLGGAAPPPPERHYSLVFDGASVTRASGTIAETLVVERPRADSLVRGRAILFRKQAGDAELRRHRRAFWSEPPPALLQWALVEALTTSGLAGRVVPAELGVAGDRALRGRLVRFERILEPEPEVVVELDVALVDLETAELLHSLRAEERVAASDGGVAASVAAFQIALDRVAARVISGLSP